MHYSCDTKVIVKKKFLVVGNLDKHHIGWHFLKASQCIDENFEFLDVREANIGFKLLKLILWRFLDRRPIKLRYFSKKIVTICRNVKITDMIVLGIAPIDKIALSELCSLGINKINFLTDDPWNQVHSSNWFFMALPMYDIVMSPRKSNIGDLKKIGIKNIYWLPFAYDVSDHKINSVQPQNYFKYDVMFVGGADNDRIPIIYDLIYHGIEPSLFGSYWDRIPKLNRFSKGIASPEFLKQTCQNSKISICLVRRANRDGHVMRSYEAAASAACMLVEDTMEHREIFGEDGECVVFFNSNEQMILRARWLLDHPEERVRLRHAVYRRIVLEGKNTYSDRLRTILETIGVKV